MNAVKVILKVVAALAAVAGIVYVIATYGDKIVAWAKKLLSCDSCADCDCDCLDCDCECACDEADVVDEASVEEAAPVEEPVADEASVEASDADFE